MKTFRAARWIPGLTLWTWVAGFVYAAIRFQADGAGWDRPLDDPWFLAFLCGLGLGPAALFVHLLRAALSPVRVDPALGLMIRGHTIPWLDVQAVRVRSSPAGLEAVADGISQLAREFFERILARHPKWHVLSGIAAMMMLVAGTMTAVFLWSLLWPVLAIAPGTGDLIILHVQGDRSITLNDLSRQEEFLRMMEKHASWAVATNLLAQPLRTGSR